MLGYGRAVTLGRRGAGDAAERSFAAADAELAVAGGGGGPGRLARRLAAEAALADGWGEPVPWLQASVGYFGGSGHSRTVSACRSLLRKAGVRVPRQHPPGADVPRSLSALGVSAREVDVLALVAQRLSNKEIAARLYVSPRTVHKHMQHLLAKTDLRDRRELAAFAAALELPPSAGEP
jgi:DNA-binding CsgD family transcriptional regulator